MHTPKNEFLMPIRFHIFLRFPSPMLCVNSWSKGQFRPNLNITIQAQRHLRPWNKSSSTWKTPFQTRHFACIFSASREMDASFPRAVHEFKLNLDFNSVYVSVTRWYLVAAIHLSSGSFARPWSRPPALPADPVSRSRRGVHKLNRHHRLCCGLAVHHLRELG